MVQHALPGAARPGKGTALRLIRGGLRAWQYHRHDRRRAGALGVITDHWLAHTMRPTHCTSSAARMRSACPALSDFSSRVFAVLRLSSFAITSPSRVLTMTRSLRRIGAAG